MNLLNWWRLGNYCLPWKPSGNYINCTISIAIFFAKFNLARLPNITFLELSLYLIKLFVCQSYQLKLITWTRNMTSEATRKAQRPREPSAISKYYLVFYNAAQVVGWESFVNVLKFIHTYCALNFGRRSGWYRNLYHELYPTFEVSSRSKFFCVVIKIAFDVIFRSYDVDDSFMNECFAFAGGRTCCFSSSLTTRSTESRNKPCGNTSDGRWSFSRMQRCLRWMTILIRCIWGRVKGVSGRNWVTFE